MFALTPAFDLESGAPPLKAMASEVQQLALGGGRMRIEAVALAADDEACAAVMLEEVYEPVLVGNEMDSTLAGAFKLDAKIGNWQQEDPQMEALQLARDLESAFGVDLPAW
jgi:hypothetical protein